MPKTTEERIEEAVVAIEKMLPQIRKKRLGSKARFRAIKRIAEAQIKNLEALTGTHREDNG